MAVDTLRCDVALFSLFDPNGDIESRDRAIRDIFGNSVASLPPRAVEDGHMKERNQARYRFDNSICYHRHHRTTATTATTPNAAALIASHASAHSGPPTYPGHE